MAKFPAINLDSEGTVIMRGQKDVEADVKVYRMGNLIIMLGTMPNALMHISISHKSRYPTWDEIAHIRYTMLPDSLMMAMILPPKSQYVNISVHCFHLFELDGQATARLRSSVPEGTV